MLTDPAQAAAFVAATGVDCLAVAVGNVHGALLPAPRALDWARLAEIRAAVDVPLALHGGTGLTPAVMRRSLREGITKVNVNTGLRSAYLAATARRASGLRTGRGPGRAARAAGGGGRGRGARDP